MAWKVCIKRIIKIAEIAIIGLHANKGGRHARPYFPSREQRRKETRHALSRHEFILSLRSFMSQSMCGATCCCSSASCRLGPTPSSSGPPFSVEGFCRLATVPPYNDHQSILSHISDYLKLLTKPQASQSQSGVFARQEHRASLRASRR